MSCDLSIIVSSYKRLNLFKRTLYSLNMNRPNCPFELVVADELSDESDAIVKELEKYKWPWTVVQCEYEAFQKLTGIQKTGNPSWTNNVAFKQCTGQIIGTLGNDILVVGDCFKTMLNLTKICRENYILYSTTYDLSKEITESIGKYGEMFSDYQLYSRFDYPSLSQELKTGVTNYLSFSPRRTWELLDGYNENYMRGLAAEDSSFTKRVGLIPDAVLKVCFPGGVTCHQYHGGISHYYNHIKDQERWDRLVAINRAYYHSPQDDIIKNSQDWPMGFSEGFKIISNH